jgi:type II secretory pathway component PulJ
MLSIDRCTMPRKISPEELKAIKKSADEALDRYVLEATLPEDLSEGGMLLHELAMQRRLERNLSLDGWPEVITQAAKRNDQKFFKKLGKILERKPLPEERRWKSRGKVAEFILGHWASEIHGVPPLCTLNTEEAAEVCSQENNGTPVTADMVVKIRQRLKLRPWHGRKMKLKRVNGNCVY